MFWINEFNSESMNRKLLPIILVASLLQLAELTQGQSDISILARIDESAEYKKLKQNGSDLYPTLQNLGRKDSIGMSAEFLSEGIEYDQKSKVEDLEEWNPLNLTDDGSALIALPFPFKFYGETYESIWINSNGNASFLESNGRYRPESFPLEIPIIAIFWTDLVQLPNKGSGVFVKSNQNEFRVVWKDMGINHSEKNEAYSFELVLGKGNLDTPDNLVLNYPDLSFLRTDSLSDDDMKTLNYVSGFDSGNGHDYRILELKDRLVYSFMIR